MLDRWTPQVASRCLTLPGAAATADDGEPGEEARMEEGAAVTQGPQAVEGPGGEGPGGGSRAELATGLERRLAASGEAQGSW
jgi:hypothetical protein